jgi:hypothetical protein
MKTSKSFHIKLILALILAVTHLSVQSQNLHVTSVTPLNQVIQAPVNTGITIQFDQPIASASVTATAFRVFGRWSGPMSGTITYEDNNQKLVFTPDDTFIAGEFVNVMLSRDIATSGGETLPAGYAWGFWAKTAPGILDQPFDYQVNLRLAGEFTLQTYGAYAGDLNNDGFSDLTVVNETSDDLRILLNDGLGQYSDFEIIPMGSSTPSPSEGGDFNNDSEIDLVVTTAWDNQIRTFVGHGDGTLTDMETYYNGDGARGVAVLDFNGDGWDDFFIVNRLSSDLTLMTNNGDGTFSVADDNTDAMGETAIMAADANQDGITDLFVAAYYSNEVLLMVGDGDGNFSISDRTDVAGQPWMISAGDYNGDGFADIATANSSGNSISIVFGDGNGGLNEAATFTATNINFPLALDAGDIDGDGDLDLATSNYGSATFTIFENNGLGEFTAAATLNAVQLSSCAILHDRDNDGDLDITGTDEGADAIIFFINPNTPVSLPEVLVVPEALTIFPNPFSSTTTFSGNWPVQGRLVITNVLGQVIREYAHPLGNVTWDGRNGHGQSLSAGLYFVHSMDSAGRVIGMGKVEKGTQ